MKALLPYSGFILAAISVVLLALGFTGCASSPTTQQELTASIAVKYATAKYIEKAGAVANQQARAARVVAVVDQIEGLAAGDTTTTVDALVAFVNGRLPVDLSPADRILAGTLIEAAAAELKARVGEGAIAADALLKVRQVLEWVRQGAIPYTAAG